MTRDFQDPRWKAARYATYTRDHFSCVNCKNKGGKLECHHIIRYADRPDLEFVISNLVTLCETCHKMVTGREDQYAPQFKKYIEQVKLTKQLLSGKKNKKEKTKFDGVKVKYKLRNPRSRY